jgi:hypothetical protein
LEVFIMKSLKKQVIALICAVGMLGAVVALPAQAEITQEFESTRPVNINDTLDILKSIVGMVDPLPLDPYDFNSNGKVEILDALECLKSMLGMLEVELVVRVDEDVPPVTTAPEVTTTLPGATTAADVTTALNYDSVIDFTVVRYARVVRKRPTHGTAFVARSWEEFQGILEIGVVEEEGNVKESDFNDKVAIVINLTHGDSSTRTIINSLVVNCGNRLLIETTTKRPCLRAEDIANWQIVLMADRAAFAGVGKDNISVIFEDIDRCIGCWSGYSNPNCLRETNEWLDSWLEAKN